MRADTFFLGFIMFLFLSLSVLIAYGVTVLDPALEKSQNKACERIGFEEYVERQEMDFCEDKKGNLYYVNLRCDNLENLLPTKKCIAKRIKVGEVWGTSEMTANGN